VLLKKFCEQIGGEYKVEEDGSEYCDMGTHLSAKIYIGESGGEAYLNVGVIAPNVDLKIHAPNMEIIKIGRRYERGALLPPILKVDVSGSEFNISYSTTIEAIKVSYVGDKIRVTID